MLKKIHRVARITALLAIPVLAVIVPQQVGKRIGDREIELEYIKVAVGIQNNSLSPSSLKEWSTQILVYFSPVEISETASDDLRLRRGSLTEEEPDPLLPAAEGRLAIAETQATDIALPSADLSRVELYEFTEDDLRLQNERIRYTKVVLAILNRGLDQVAVRSISLAAISWFNRSLEFKDWDAANLDKHVQEIENVHELLLEKVVGFSNLAAIGAAKLQLEIAKHNAIIILER